MTRNINTIVLTGHLTADPAVNANGTVAKFTLAVNGLERNGEGGWTDTVDFIDCKCFQKGVFNYLTKGVEVSITGSLKQEKWEKDGQKKSRLIVNVDDLILGDRPKAKEAV